MSVKCTTRNKALSPQKSEYVAIRENLKLQEARANGLLKQHAGESFGSIT